MNSERKVTNERVDDIPVLVASQAKLGLAEVVNEVLEPHGNWQGVTPGTLLIVWLSYILSEGDHRLNQVEEWVEKRQRTLGHYVDEPLTVNDFRDDRLAILLRLLSDDESWSALEAQLNRRTIRVYALETDRIRLDSTTANGHWQVTPDGLFQYGHSKDHRPDLPQLKVQMATLDPLGMPLVTLVVEGKCADDPLYRPAIDAVRKSLARCGLLYIGDTKMAAAATRAAVADQDDYYLCPLSAVQLPREQLLAHIAERQKCAAPLQKVERCQADGQILHLGDGFERTVAQSVDLDGETVDWTERQLIVRSEQYAASQTKAVRHRLTRSQRALEALNERTQGKAVLRTITDAQAAVEKILAKEQTHDFFHVELQTIVHQRHVRRYGERPPRIETTQEIHVLPTLDEAAVAQFIDTLGWRCYVTNAPRTDLSLPQAVLAYRNQYTQERAFGRLKGKPLSLTPMYLEKEEHATGLVRLLSLGLRILSLLEFSVRRSLRQTASPLTGLYAGNPKRSTPSPSAELLLSAFNDLILTVVTDADSVSLHLTPLSDTQSHILALLGFGHFLYLSLVDSLSCKPLPFLHEP